jgi:hypothetical protein
MYIVEGTVEVISGDWMQNSPSFAAADIIKIYFSI